MRALVTRRSFVAAGLALGAAVATGAAALRLPLAAPGAVLLSRRELDIVGAVAEVMFPRDPMPLDGLEAQVPVEVDRILAHLMDTARAAAFRYVLRALEVGTLASRGRRFTDLPAPERLEVLEAWSLPGVVPRRLGLDAIKLVLGMAYFRHPAVIAQIGWRTPCSVGGAA